MPKAWVNVNKATALVVLFPAIFRHANVEGNLSPADSPSIDKAEAREPVALGNKVKAAPEFAQRVAPFDVRNGVFQTLGSRVRKTKITGIRDPTAGCCLPPLANTKCGAMPVGSSQMRAVVTTEHIDPDIVDKLMIFRKKLFVDALGWDLPKRFDGRERDQFDTSRAVHVALLTGDEVVGGFRAIRADDPYLARSLFPHLATSSPYPVSSDAWEISRFGVSPKAGNLIAKLNYSLMFWFARTRHARSLVALADLTYERFLWRLGVKTVRFGEPQAIGMDVTGQPIVAVAGELLLAAQSGRRFDAIASLVDNVEITDETLVLGRTRLSA